MTTGSPCTRCSSTPARLPSSALCPGTDGRRLRPAHHQRSLRGAGAPLAVRPREPHVQPGVRPAAGRVRGRHAGLEGVRRSGRLRATAARQPDPAAGRSLARGRLSRRDGNDPPAPPALARPGDLAGAPVLLLPARGGRDPDLAHGDAGRRPPGHRGAGRRRALPAALRQDGHRVRQDPGDGHGDRLARAQPDGEPPGLPLLEARAGAGARPDREEAPGGPDAVRPRQLLRPLRHGSLGLPGAAPPGACSRPQLARPELGDRGAARPEAWGGQARRQERRRLRQGGAGRHRDRLEPPGRPTTRPTTPGVSRPSRSSAA
jgi:hypothetical protein